MKKRKWRGLWRSRRACIRIDYLLRKTAKELGHNNERRVVEAYETEDLSDHRPRWIEKVRVATYDEDQRGIDVVFTTDAGKIFLQIKGNIISQKKFCDRQNAGMVNKDIVTAIIYPSHLPQEIRQIITPLLRQEYARLTALRHTPSC